VNKRFTAVKVSRAVSVKKSRQQVRCADDDDVKWFCLFPLALELHPEAKVNRCAEPTSCDDCRRGRAEHEAQRPCLRDALINRAGFFLGRYQLCGSAGIQVGNDRAYALHELAAAVLALAM
jgi:hypothetical protein